MGENEEKIDYLEVDDQIPGQNYVCLSFVSPESMIESKESFKVAKFLQSVCKDKDMDFKNFDKISEKLTSKSIEEALKLIRKNLNSLGVNHDNFVSEKNLVVNQEVEKVVDFLLKNKFVYKGKIKAPAGEDDNNWVEENNYFSNQLILVMTKIEHYKNPMVLGLILPVMLPTIKINWIESLTT